MLKVGLTEAAGRTAYLASFHAAQALIFERSARTLKTHSGVQDQAAQAIAQAGDFVSAVARLVETPPGD